jgi:hypothetical protein
MAEKDKAPPAGGIQLDFPGPAKPNFSRPVMDNSAASMFGTHKTLIPNLKCLFHERGISVKQIFENPTVFQ